VLVLEYRRINQNKANGGRIMNAQTLIERKSDLKTVRNTGLLRALQSEIVRLRGRISESARARLKRLSSRKNKGYQIGQTVHHGDFGSGRIVAAWPDGRLLVKFTSRGDNLLVFPSLLMMEHGR
jgi:hypothetical protein